ncbi:hypothetical protein [Flavivirga algicola]|nr:hypothetical protein [Flavivirga algicola]
MGTFLFAPEGRKIKKSVLKGKRIIVFKVMDLEAGLSDENP